ncbi:radical SAM/SPASM domain-containing protein [Candidatus Pelagibacter sp.]|nr:radical SAM/SPASM domain-containing protein [Candidatus Pelagibacter sp.]
MSLKSKLKNLLNIYTPNFLFKKIPHMIIIETTNICNLRCPVCPTTIDMTRSRGFMDFKLFKNIIDEFTYIKKKPEIAMNFSGEPTLHKDIYSFVEYASKKGHRTYISTNVTAMNENNSIKLIKSGLSDIHLCIDGFSNESHDTYRIGSRFEIIKRNIETFLSAKKKLNSQVPNVCIQTLLTSLSENEKEDMVEWARKIGANSIDFKSFNLGSFTSKEIKEKYSYLLPSDEKFKRHKNAEYKKICTIPYHQVVVYWNGDLGLCCTDFDKKVKMPNIRNTGSLLKTIYSKEVINVRKTGLNKKYDICKTCSIGNADYMGYNYSFKNKETKDGIMHS